MRRLRLLVLASSLAACGVPAAHGPSASSGAGGEVASSSVEAQARRIRELEGMLARRTAEVEELRAALDEARSERTASTRIGRPRLDDEGLVGAEIDDGGSLAAAEAPAPLRASSSRPVLRLQGPPRAPDLATMTGPSAPASVPAMPAGASLGRLPVVGVPGFPDDVPAIPDVPVAVVPASTSPSASPPPTAPLPTVPIAPPPPSGSTGSGSDPAVSAYQAALAHVEARHWAEALPALERFVRDHADHPYADNAMYWQGEVLAAQRQYARAVEVFERLVARYPSGNKVPDALLRAGACHQRLGDTARARAAFQRLRAQFPDSVAARMASREET